MMDYKKAATYWTEKDIDTVKMEPASLRAEIEKFILAHNTCALATGFGTFVRCTPIEYTYKGRKFWMLSEGGQKFIGLEENKNVALAIYDNYAGFGNLGGLQVTGVATIVEPWSEEYLALLAYKKIPAQSLKKLPNAMHMIQVTPVEMDFLNSELKEQGVSTRQHLSWEEG